jgi:hypothetical protein
MEEHGYEGISRDASTLAFQVLFKAIEDAFGIGTVKLSGGSISQEAKDGEVSRNIQSARAFIASEDLETLCELAALHYEVPRPSKVRERLARFIASGEEMNIREVYKETHELHRKPKKEEEEVLLDDLPELPELKNFGRLAYGRDAGWKGSSPTAQEEHKEHKEHKKHG